MMQHAKSSTHLFVTRLNGRFYVPAAPAVTAQAQAMYDNYVEYGRRFMKIVEDCKKGL